MTIQTENPCPHAPIRPWQDFGYCRDCRRVVGDKEVISAVKTNLTPLLRAIHAHGCDVDESWRLDIRLEPFEARCGKCGEKLEIK